MIKKSYEKRVINDYWEFLDKASDYGLFCLPIAAVQVARNYWSSSALWPTSYSKSVQGDRDYVVPTDEEMDVIRFVISQALEGASMAFCTDIISKLSEIADAVGNGGSGGGCNVTINNLIQSSTGDVGTVQSITDDFDSEGEPPSGYSEVVGSYRCNRSNAVVDWLIAVLRSFRDGNVIYTVAVGATVAISVIAGIYAKTLIGAELLKRLGYISSLVNALKEGVDLDLCVEFLEDNKQEIVCAVATSGNTDEVLSLLGQLFGSGLDAVNKAFLMAVVSYDFVAIAWYNVTGNSVLNDELNNHQGDVDCYVCTDGDYDYNFAYGKQGWEIVETLTHTPVYTGGYFQGSRTGTGSANLYVISPSVRYTFNKVLLGVWGSGGQITAAHVQISDDKVNWTSWRYNEYYTTATQPTEISLEYNMVSEKYVRVYLSKFQTNPSARLYYVKFRVV